MKEDPTIGSEQQRNRNSRQSGMPQRLRSRRYGAALILFVALVAVSFVIWKAFFARRTPENIITLSGRIEGDDSAISPKTAGRILKIRYREGDDVQR